MQRIYIIAWILILLNSIHSFAIKPVLITNDFTTFRASNNYVEIYEDSSNSLTISDILQIPKGNLTDAKLVNRNTNFTYWLKFKISTKTQNRKKWILEIMDSKFKSVTLYVPDQHGNYQAKNAGTNYPFYTREYDHKNLVFDLNLNPDTDQFYFLKFNPDRRGSLLFNISTNHQFSKYSLREYYLLGFYYGILFIIAIYNFILYFTLKEKIYLFYILYVLAWAWNSLIDDGLGLQYLWTSIPIISQIGFYASKPLLLILFVVYSRLFLNLISYSPKLDRIIIYAAGIYSVIDILFYPFKLHFAIITFFYLIPFILIYYTSLKIYRKGYLPARFFIISNTMVIIGLIISMLKASGLLKMITSSEFISVIGVYGFNIGIFAEIIIFSVALGDRIRFLKKAELNAQKKIIDQLVINEKLSNKVNKELEEKVAERTKELNQKARELEEANLKLSKQAEEINRWNQRLDLDNHQLKTKVKEAVEARIKFRDISFQDFLSIFSDDMACKRYIEEIKWKNGFVCKKCGNTKYCLGNKQFSRRCTKCRYDESITAYTILHKCKFPLVKAFYIITKVNKYDEDLNCNELARILEIRTPTVWELKKKILEVKKLSKTDPETSSNLDYLILNSLK